MHLELPDNLLDDARRGRLVLFLGAGATIGATSATGRGPLTGDELRDELSKRFLGGKKKDQPLSWVAELSISENDIGAVQDFIADLFRDLRPAPFHRKLPTFRWRGIATTNYDTLLETIYEDDGRIQELVPIRSDSDRIDQLLRSESDLALLKLHGCITRTRDKQTPFILTTDQYVKHRRGREQLFATLLEWGAQFPIVFVGHAGQDIDLRNALLELSEMGDFRPRYFLLRPQVDATEAQFWAAKRITVLNGTFEDFLDALDKAIEPGIRPVLQEVQTTHAIQRRFFEAESVSTLLMDYLTQDFEYVHDSMGYAGGNPQDFYKGFDFGWYPVAEELDVRRDLTDRLLNDVIIRAEEDRPAVAELYVLTAEAGAGKSVFLRRLAWEAAKEADALCLFLRTDGLLRYDALKEINRLTHQRLFLFVDSAASHVQELAYAMTTAMRERLPLTIVTAERRNEWNMACERLEPLATELFPLRYLNLSEIGRLVDLLAKHDSLGPHLTGKPRDDCIKEFEFKAGRQLLVALHEATVGGKFEDILFDEYSNVQPNAARQLYLTVCVMNRLKVEVRAGLIARVHGIAFTDFKEELFAPLEHVVKVRQQPGTKDYVYTARHPEIAQVVFDRVLNTAPQRYNEYIRILANLNLSYTTDRSALRGMVRAKSLNDLFPSYEDVTSLYKKALDVGPREAYTYQQQANYERIRANGNLSKAESMLDTARELDPRDLSIIHTLAEIKKTRADRATHSLERERFRNEARALLVPLLKDVQHGPYARVTLVRVALDDLRDVLARPESSDKEIDEAIRVTEQHLGQAQQQFPGETFLLTAEAEFGKLLSDHERSFKALTKAFEANSRDSFIAGRLARLHQEQGDLSGAEAILAKALEANRSDKHLNFQYANVLRQMSSPSNALLIYHYHRAFTKWDTNYDAQFWYARFAFESEQKEHRDESKKVFAHLREVPLPPDVRNQVRDGIGDAEKPQWFYGRLIRRQYDYGFIEREGEADWIFCHQAKAPLGELAVGDRVRFRIGFSFGGAIALDLRGA